MNTAYKIVIDQTVDNGKQLLTFGCLQNCTGSMAHTVHITQDVHISIYAVVYCAMWTAKII